MQKTLQSNVFYANLCAEPGSNVQGGTRPVIVVSNEVYNRTSDSVTIIPLSTRHSHLGFYRYESCPPTMQKSIKSV